MFGYYEARKRLRKAYMVRGAMIGLGMGLFMLGLRAVKAPVVRWLASLDGSPWAPPDYYVTKPGGYEAWIDLLVISPSLWSSLGPLTACIAGGAWFGTRYAIDPPAGVHRISASASILLFAPFLPWLVWLPSAWSRVLCFLIMVILIYCVDSAVRRGRLPRLRAPALRDEFPDDFPANADA